MSRRRFLRLSGDLALLCLLPGGAAAAAAARAEAAAGGDGSGVFLSAAQMRTLRALCDRFVPGPPDDPDPGALAADVPAYIDLLLGAFTLPHPPIFAGGPFSLRDGGGRDAFADFLVLDALEERVWRTRIEGSRGIPEREWNGPVVGLQEVYTAGLARLDETSRHLLRAPFHELPKGRADWLLRLATGELGSFLDVAFGHVLEGMYGAPEYGGNQGRVGWSYTHWPGDRQPLMWMASQISEPDPDQAEAVARARANARAWAGTPEPSDG